MTPVSLPALAFGLIVASTLTPGIGKAAMIAYDGFNTYTAGTDLAAQNGGTGWTTAWGSATGANDVVAGGLNYAGGSISVSGGANTMQKSSGAGGLNADPYFNRSFTSTSSTEVWMSFLFHSTNLGGTDFLEFYLSDAAGEGNSGAALINFAQTTDEFGVRANPTILANPLTTYGGGTVSSTPTYLMVLRISGDGAGSATNYDRVELWLNPTSTTLGTATASRDLDMEMSSLAYFGVRAANLASTDVFQVDELRIGETKLDVVPEPSVVSVFAMGTLLLALRRRSARNLIHPFGNL